MTVLQVNFTNISSSLLSNSNNSCIGGTPGSHIAPTSQNGNFIVCLVLGVVVVIENSLVCLAFAFNRKLRKRQANILVCSQASADLFNGLIFVPIELYEKYSNHRLLTPYLIAYVLFVSLFNLFSLALDRYLALIKPLLHHLVMDVNRTKKLLIVNWLVPLLITSIPLCWSSSSIKTIEISSRVYVCIFWLFMLCLCVIMIVMYILIYRTAAKTIRQRRKRMARLSKDPENKIKTTRTELRVAHLFGLLLFFFMLAYLPILYLNLMDILGQVHLIFPIIEQLSLYSLIINSVVNPILCLLLKKDYQLIIKRWICFEWIADQRRGESIHSQASYKTVMENTEGQDSTSDFSKKRRISRGYSLRRSDQRDTVSRWTDALRNSFKRQKSTNTTLGKDGSVKRDLKTGGAGKSTRDDNLGIRKTKSYTLGTKHCSQSQQPDSKYDIPITPGKHLDMKTNGNSGSELKLTTGNSGSFKNNNVNNFRSFVDDIRDQHRISESSENKRDYSNDNESMEAVELVADTCLFSKTSESKKANETSKDIIEIEEEGFCEIQPILT